MAAAWTAWGGWRLIVTFFPPLIVAHKAALSGRHNKTAMHAWRSHVGDACFRRSVVIRPLLNMFIDVKGPTSLEFVTTCKIYAEVIENAWPPFPACECVELYGAITNGILNLVDEYFEMQKHNAVRALEIYEKAGEPSSIHSTSKRNT